MHCKRVQRQNMSMRPFLMTQIKVAIRVRQGSSKPVGCAPGSLILRWASLFCLIAHAAVECIAASLSMDRLASNKDVTAMFADPVQPLLHIHFLRLLLTKRFFRVGCIFVLIVMYSASFQALVLPACSFLARPFCVGLLRGRHSLK